MIKPLLKIDSLSIGFGTDPPVVDKVSLEVSAGRMAAIVGESGSGKTMLARSILGLLPTGAIIRSGTIGFNDRDISNLPVSELQSVRGAEIGMIFQEPMVSLNPSLKIGFQMTEAIRKHRGLSEPDALKIAIEYLDRVRITSPENCLNEYPHEFSGGMRQRIMIASTLMLSPKLLIADEPTTALDCLVQKDVLEILGEISKSDGTSILLISHDLSQVAHYADDVLVMEKGKAVEHGVVSEVIGQPSHEYTQKLLDALPKAKKPSSHDLRGGDLVTIRNLNVQYPVRKKWIFEPQKYKPVLHDISLDMRSGETLAVVGESGSGKTTLGRAMLQLVPASSGSIKIGGHTITDSTRPDFRTMKSVVQLIFQDPYSSLSPRQKISEIVAEPLRLQGDSDTARKAEILLEEVGLGRDFLARYPNELSGGQRQRVSIARALVSDPQLVVADEPVSALDITVQAQILRLLDRLRLERGFSCMFISHDLGVVEQIADKVAVLYKGQLVEHAPAHQIFAHPCHPYTRRLLSALPELKRNGRGGYNLVRRSPDPFEFPDGLSPAGHGPASEIIYHEVADDHLIACVEDTRR